MTVPANAGSGQMSRFPSDRPEAEGQKTTQSCCSKNHFGLTKAGPEKPFRQPVNALAEY
jgi:hypothetical protein